MMLREIEKCDVRCANCHRRKTLAEVNSWRHRVFLANLVVDVYPGAAGLADVEDDPRADP
jgi:hypothetical protein